MGRLAADDMVAEAAAQGFPRNIALEWHLTSNHYPPVHRDFIPIAEQAIEDVDCGNGDNQILMPNGKQLTAWQIVEGLHLESFLESESEDYDDDD